MTPKDKAKILVFNYILLDCSLYLSKKYALVLVDEMIKYIDNTQDNEDEYNDLDYFMQVKQEINKL